MTKLDLHATAASHHGQAAKSHREASEPFEAGKDPQHWAHQALLANGHTLRAIESSNAAREHYARYDKSAPQYSSNILRFPANAFEKAEAMGTILHGTQQHAVAADHHERAVRHHNMASRYCAARNYAPATEEAVTAQRHAQQAAFQSHEAARHYIEHHFNTGTGIEVAQQRATSQWL